jgi:hypothetical protein
MVWTAGPGECARASYGTDPAALLNTQVIINNSRAPKIYRGITNVKAGHSKFIKVFWFNSKIGDNKHALAKRWT